jgi:hypothetical protein
MDYVAQLFGSAIRAPVYNEFSFNRLLISENIVPENVYKIGNFHRNIMNQNQRSMKYALFATITSKIMRSKHHNSEHFIILTDLLSSISAKLSFSEEISRIINSSLSALPLGTAILLTAPHLQPAGKEEGGNDRLEFIINSASQLIVLGQVEHYGICQGIRRNGEACKIAIDKQYGLRCCYHKHMTTQDEIALQAAASNAAKQSTFALVDNIENNNNHRCAIEVNRMVPLGPNKHPANTAAEKYGITSANVMAAMLGLAPVIDKPESSTNQPNESVFEFASRLHVQKLEQKAQTVQPMVAKSSKLVDSIQSSRASIPQPQLSRLGSLTKNPSHLSVMKPDSHRMYGNVIVDANILAKNEKSYMKVKEEKAVNKREETVKKRKLDDELDQLLSRKSSHAIEAQASADEEYDKHLSKLVAREQVLLKKSKASSTIFINQGYYCSTCKLCFESISSLCREKHPTSIIPSKLLKRFYECGGCLKRTSVLLVSAGNLMNESLTTPNRRCELCSANNWRSCSSSTAASALNSRVTQDERLILSASEWTSSKDVDSMNAMIGKLS